MLLGLRDWPMGYLSHTVQHTQQGSVDSQLLDCNQQLIPQKHTETQFCMCESSPAALLGAGWLFDPNMSKHLFDTSKNLMSQKHWNKLPSLAFFTKPRRCLRLLIGRQGVLHAFEKANQFQEKPPGMIQGVLLAAHAQEIPPRSH